MLHQLTARGSRQLPWPNYLYFGKEGKLISGKVKGQPFSLVLTTTLEATQGQILGQVPPYSGNICVGVD